MKNILFGILGVLIMMVIVIVAAFSPRKQEEPSVPRRNESNEVSSLSC